MPFINYRSWEQHSSFVFVLSGNDLLIVKVNLVIDHLFMVQLLLWAAAGGVDSRPQLMAHWNTPIINAIEVMLHNSNLRYRGKSTKTWVSQNRYFV